MPPDLVVSTEMEMVHMSIRKSFYSGILVSLAAILMLLMLTGCQGRNRFSMHGSDIMQYQGDEEVLMNCCSAAMALLAEDIKQNNELDSYPLMYQKSAGWSTTKKVLTGETSKTAGWRMTLTCDDDSRQHRIEIAWIQGRPAIIIISRPDDNDDALVIHVKKLFSNFDVKLVGAI
jgi:hypothetical protein